MIFKPRLTAPAKDDKRFINYEYGGWSIAIPIDKKTGYTLPNCVGYAHGRLLEILGKNCVDWKIPAGNAEDFVDKAKENGMSTGTVPKLGAAICWRAGQKHNSADGCGHVAVVEQIDHIGNDIELTCGAAELDGREFYTFKVRKSEGYIYNNTRPIEGFVYCGIEFDAAESQSNDNSIVAGKKIQLNNTPCYTSEITPIAYGHKTGTFYLWDSTVRNGRIRITNTPERVGVAGQVTCWAPIGALGLSQGSSPASAPGIAAGKKVQFYNVAVYSSETGASIGTRTGTYYTWDSTVRNGRIRMTNAPGRVGVAGQVSFWASVADIQ